MSRTKWKQREREAATIIGGKRYTANQGGDVDCESAGYCVQVKERRTLSLAALEGLTTHIDRVATQRNKAGLVMVKRSAGRGTPTPWLIVMTEATFRYLNGRLPTEGGDRMDTEKPQGETPPTPAEPETPPADEKKD